jgi:branched-chain amino acid transport system ATP-binding protein
MLDVKDIHTYYGKSYVLQGVSLGVTPGKIVALLGRNGAGKTTTLRSIMGLTPPARGTISLEGRRIDGKKTYRISNLGIGYVPGDRQIFTECSVYENLLIGAREGSIWNHERVYEIFPVLKDRAKHSGRELSGGEQQMLAIARALMGGPKLLLLDEPSQGLAPLIVRAIGDVMKDLKAKGITILLVEQNVEMTMRIADHYYIIDQGRVVYSGDKADFERKMQVREKYLGV